MSADAWFGIAGSLLGGVTGAILSYWYTSKQRAEDRREKSKALALSFVAKLIRLSSHLDLLHNYVEKAHAEATARQSELWRWLRPLAHPMDQVHFTADELAVLIGIKADKALNAVVTLDEIHNGTLALFKTYDRSRSALEAAHPVPVMNGTIGQVHLTPEDVVRLSPQIAAINELVDYLRERCTRDAHDASRALFDIHALLMEAKLISFSIALKASSKEPQSQLNR